VAEETMNEFVLGFTRVWHDPKVRVAEQVDKVDMDLSNLPSAFRLESHGKELLCAVMINEARGLPAVLYNVIGDVVSDAELQDMADQKWIGNGCSCVMSDGTVHDPELNPGANEE
jgi:hypothetical protein